MQRRLSQALGLGAVLIGYATVKALVSESRHLDLRNKNVLITGGSRGLGLVMAREFSDFGARVAVCARDEEELGRVRQEFASSGGDFLALTCDLADRAQVEKMIAEVETKLGPVDVLVNNAGTMLVGPLEHMTLQDFEDTMQVNFWGAVYTTMAVIDGMKRRGGGRIVNITSIGGKVAFPHLLPYTASKFALVGFSEGLRPELAKDDIWVTTVCPGLMRTGSPRNVDFKGEQDLEYTWFTLSDSLPGASMSAVRAAKKIVNACIHGEAEVVLSLPAKLAVIAEGIMPGVMGDLLSTVNERLLPAPFGVRKSRRKGYESETPVTRSPLTGLTQAAEQANNEI